MSYAEYKHYFDFDSSNNIKFEDPIMFGLDCNRHRGKRKYILIRSEGKTVEHKVFKFYFGVVIKKYCLESNIFSGYTKDAIHQVLFAELRGKPIMVKQQRYTFFEKPFHTYEEDDMRRYLDELIPHLAVNYNIHVKSKSEDYDYRG